MHYCILCFLARNLELGLEVSHDVITIRSGQTVNLTCSVTEDASLMWIFRNNHTLPANIIVSSSSRQSILTITEANTDNSGIYTCLGMQVGTELTADRFVIVNVRGNINNNCSGSCIKALSQLLNYCCPSVQ